MARSCSRGLAPAAATTTGPHCSEDTDGFDRLTDLWLFTGREDREEIIRVEMSSGLLAVL
jgi:hypothetical protein